MMFSSPQNLYEMITTECMCLQVCASVCNRIFEKQGIKIARMDVRSLHCVVACVFFEAMCVYGGLD